MRLALLLFSTVIGCGGDGGAVDGGVDASAATDGGFIDELARACAVSASCGVDVQPGAIGQCVLDHLARAEAPIWTPSVAATLQADARFVGCAKSADSCASFIDCYSAGHGSAWFATHPSSACDGAIAVNRFGRPGTTPLVEDCGAEGMTCTVQNGKIARCTDGNPCAMGAPPCASATTVCYDGVEELCPAATFCVDAGGLPICVPAGAACARAACTDGGQGSLCFPLGDGGMREALRCPDYQQHCVGPDLFGDVQCVPDPIECEVPQTGETCDGAAIVICANGRLTRIDCPALGLGFATCGTPADGTLGGKVCR